MVTANFRCEICGGQKTEGHRCPAMFLDRRHDPDETEGRALYRQIADQEAAAQVAYAKRGKRLRLD